MRASPHKAISGLDLLDELIREIIEPIPRTDQENAEILAEAAVRIAEHLREADAETGGTGAQPNAAEQNPAAAPVSAADLQAELADWQALSSRAAPPGPDMLTLLLPRFPTITGPTDYSATAVDPAMPDGLRLEHRLCNSLPGWVPRLVRYAFARLVLSAAVSVGNIERYVRLGKDPRMKSVWGELQRRSRNDRRYLHPPRIRWTGDDETDQQFAIAALFTGVLELHRRPVRAATERELALWQQALDTMRRAAALQPHRLVWENGQTLTLNIDDGNLRGATLLALVAQCERLFAERYDTRSALLIRRHTGVHWKNPATHLAEPPELRPFIIRALDLTRELFDKPLYGCVATIASVLFQPQSVTVRRVRSCAKSRVQNATSETEKAHVANRDKADRFAAEVLPIVHELQKTGVSGLRAIAARLNARGIRTRRNETWHASTIRNLLARDKRQAQ